MNSSFDLLKLHVTIFTEESDDPTAIKLELGWKLIEMIGDLVNFYLTATVQQEDSTL